VATSILTEEELRREFLKNLLAEVAELIHPATIRLAWTQINRPGVLDAPFDLHLDYRTNTDLYPGAQAYFRQRPHAPRILWRRSNKYYSPAAALLLHQSKSLFAPIIVTTTRKLLVRKGGLEPPPLAGPDPKSGASANSATFALLVVLINSIT
jgi:hypothetical protein